MVKAHTKCFFTRKIKKSKKYNSPSRNNDNMQGRGIHKTDENCK